MKNLHKLMDEITQITSNIETNYPELYQFLDENPITIGSVGQPSITKQLLQSYLESLIQQLKHHIEKQKRN